MKKLVLVLSAIFMLAGLSTTADAQGKGHKRGKYKAKHGTTVVTPRSPRIFSTTQPVRVKGSVNRAGNLNNGNRGDWRNSRGRGDVNNRPR